MSVDAGWAVRFGRREKHVRQWDPSEDRTLAEADGARMGPDACASRPCVQHGPANTGGLRRLQKWYAAIQECYRTCTCLPGISQFDADARAHRHVIGGTFPGGSTPSVRNSQADSVPCLQLFPRRLTAPWDLEIGIRDRGIAALWRPQSALGEKTLFSDLSGRSDNLLWQLGCSASGRVINSGRPDHPNPRSPGA